MIPDDVVERVREHADLVAVVGEFVKLKRVGTSWRGPCPFHHGTHDNFSITPRGGYKCFVCGESGDVFTFVQKQLGLDFVESVKWVGAKSGIEVREVVRPREERDDREPLWEACAAAAEWFERMLWDDAQGAPARDYLAGRGLTREQVVRFGLGYAPRDANLLRAHLQTLGYGDELLLEAGILVQREGERDPRGRFRNRLMFPIHDVQGRVVAFGGRIVGQGEPKYLNSPESRIFSKGKTLFGLNWARHAIRKDDRVLLVEGNFDLVRLMVAGIESVVAPLGTALTLDQAKLLRRYTRNVFLLYDSDKAGLKATFRAGDVLLAEGCSVQVLTLPEGEDPDTFVRAHGPERLLALLGGAIDVFERKIQILERGGWFADLRRTRAAVDRLLPTIRVTADPLTRDLYLARASEASGVGRELLAREVEAAPPEPEVGRPTSEAGRDGGRRERGGAPRDGVRRFGERRQPNVVSTRIAERELIRVLLHHPSYVEQVAERVGEESFQVPVYRRLFGALVVEGESRDVQRMADGLDPEAIRTLQELLAESGGLDLPGVVVEDSVRHLVRRELRARLIEMERDLELLARGEERQPLEQEAARLRQELRELGFRRWKMFDRPL